MESKIKVVIIGSGIAGYSAAIYLKRSNVPFLLLDKGAPGGKLLTIPKIDNYPSEASISGPQLANKIIEHAKALGIESTYAEVYSVSKLDNGSFLISTDMGNIESQAIIVASGSSVKPLGVPGEKEFLGRGVSYCATCDGAFFKNKEVAVFGNKDQAVEEALYLANLASKVYFFYEGELNSPKSHIDELNNLPNVDIIPNSKLLSINGEKLVSSIEALTNNEKKTYSASGVFPFAGEKSSSDFLAPLGLETQNGFIKVNPEMESSVPGLFSAGDVNAKKLRQLVTAESDGAIAATSAFVYLRNH